MTSGDPAPNPLDYYDRPGRITEPREHGELLQNLPAEIPALCRIVQGILIHSSEARRYGVKLPDRRKKEKELRYIARMLARIQEMDDRPLTIARPPSKRLVGTCRDFALTLCAILRQQGVPARVRCGFATYFSKPGTYIDHWVCEYWQTAQERWVLVDAQLDEIQCKAYRIAFDACDVPSDKFLLAGRAWQLCRTGQADWRRFGYRRYRGFGFIRSSLLKDFTALNKIEALPSDHWWGGLLTQTDLSQDDLRYLDHIAAVTLDGNEVFAVLRAMYESDPHLYMPVESGLQGIEQDKPPARTDKVTEHDIPPAPGAVLPAAQRQAIPPAQAKVDVDKTRSRLRSRFRPRERATDLEPDKIVIRGAQQHNLKNIDISIPRYKLVVLTGVSGSGKSSLAFDTIFAEAQRRYVESLSPFIRHFLEKADKPKVDFIGGLNPAIAIEQKRISKNPRSTVGTVTEILHYLRLLYARVGTAHCLECGRAIQPQSPRQIADRLSALPPGTRLRLLAPVVRQREGAQDEVIERARQAGYLRARVNGVFVDLHSPTQLPETEKHTIELLIEQLQVAAENEGRTETFYGQLVASVKTALRIGHGVLVVGLDDGDEMMFSSERLCPKCDVYFPELTSQHFSFNSPFGMCPDCHGLGTTLRVAPHLLISDPRLSILDGALSWFGNLRINKRSTWPLGPLDIIADYYGVDLNTAWQDLPPKFRDVILYGSGDEKLQFSRQSSLKQVVRPVKGLIPEITRLFYETESESTRNKYRAYMTQRPCSTCGGSRLCPEARAVTLGGKAIAEVSIMPIDQALVWVEKLVDCLDQEQLEIADEILTEIYKRLSFMIDVSLHYLTLDRSAPSLSGGEGQRVRIASQLACGLVGVLYILDEPSIGLHARDQRTLLDTLLQLRDIGNTVLVVEHDPQTIRAADWVIDMGPGAGVLGGEVVATGPPESIAANPHSLTGRYLSGKLAIVTPNGEHRRPTRGWLTIMGARLHNLKNVTAHFPLGLITCVTGVSGSGKSSLIAETLEPALARVLHRAQSSPGPYERLEGLENLDKVVNITQDPIGRTPRSNPATYTRVFDEIRKVFAGTPAAKRRRFHSARFSFNDPSGRCEACNGLGQQRIEMHFLTDVQITCQECNGTRYHPETLAIQYQGKNIAEVLDLDVQEALEFFSGHRKIIRILQTLQDVGLGYIKLGQSATTLSGGEAQRVKLARELSRIATGKTIYILDEPTTGLHFADIQHLLNVLHQLVDAGNTVVIIEHNLDVMKSADWIIDLGPEGGEAGGAIIAQGPPEEVARVEVSYTGRALREVLQS